MTRIILNEILRAVILNLLYTPMYSDGSRLYPELNPLVRRPFKLTCDTDTNFTSTITIILPNGITAGYCYPASTLVSADCTGSLGYSAALNETENTVTISASSLASDVNGTWTCSYLGDPASYNLTAPIREITNESLTLFPPSFTDNITSETASMSLSATYGCINLPVYFKWFVVDSASNKIDISGTSNAAENSSLCTSGFNEYTETKEVNEDVYLSSYDTNLNGSYRLGVEVHFTDEVTTLHSIKYFDTYFVFNPTSSVSRPSPVSTDIMNYETISTVSDNITEALTITSDVSLTTQKATRTLTESVNTVNYDSSVVINTEFYTIHTLSTTGLETHVPQSSLISSDLDTSMQTSLLTTNSSVSMDLISNNTAMTVSDINAASLEDASTTTGILTTTFDSATSNIGSINSLITHSSIVTTPLFYTTDNLSVTEVETSLLHSDIISSDSVTSIQASLLAKNSSLSMDLMNNNTADTVGDTTTASTEGVTTTTGILTAVFNSTTGNTASIDSLIIHSSISTTPLFYTTDKLSATKVETAQMPSGTISSDFVTSVAASSFAENSSIPTDFMNNKTVMIVSSTTIESFAVTTPIQSAFSENFIIISASVAGFIIIVFGSLMVLYWLNKLPGQQRHKSNELHRDKPDNISCNSFSPNNYMHNESYAGPVYQYSNIPLRLTSRYNLPYSYDHHIHYENNWNNI